MNGAATEHTDEEPKFMQINAKVGFSTKQVLAGLGTLLTAIGALFAAGWLAMPAKQVDVTRLEQGVSDLRLAVGTLGEHTKGLAEAVVSLQGAIYEIQVKKEGAPAPRPRVIRSKPKAQEAKPQAGFFGFN